MVQVFRVIGILLAVVALGGFGFCGLWSLAGGLENTRSAESSLFFMIASVLLFLAAIAGLLLWRLVRGPRKPPADNAKP